MDRGGMNSEISCCSEDKVKMLPKYIKSRGKPVALTAPLLDGTNSFNSVRFYILSNELFYRGHNKETKKVTVTRA